MAAERLDLIWGVAFGAGALAQLLAHWTGLPSVVLLLAVGLLVGQGGLCLVEPQALGHGLEPVVGLLVSMVLFDGGLGLRLRGPTSLRTLTTLRLVWVRWPLGLLGGAAAAQYPLHLHRRPRRKIRNLVRGRRHPPNPWPFSPPPCSERRARRPPKNHSRSEWKITRTPP